MNAIGFEKVSSARFAEARRRDGQCRCRRWIQRIILSLGAGLALIGAAAAQDYPVRQIVVIVPFPAGGSTDILARIISEPMRQALGQPVVVQNVPGAGATIGVARAIQSAPDGYTLIVGNWTSHVGGSAYFSVAWNVLTYLEPVALLSATPLIIAGRTGLPVNDSKELLAWLKSNPDRATMATLGAGSGAHVCGIYFEQKTGTRFRYVPYKGGAPVMADLLGNQVDLFCGEASQMLPHFRAGKLKPLVVMSKARWRLLPEVPTMEDVGASDTHIAFWQGMWAPKGTPRQVIEKVTDAVVKAFADPVVIKRLTELGQDLPSREQLTPQALAAYHKSEIDKWWPLIEGANTKVE
jgi:tripartite-type tricarboxylate transporter receptor subunit TctC